MSEMQASPFAYALADFSSKLYDEIGAEKSDSNIFISPLSVSFALAMTYAGADGNTKQQLKEVIFGNWRDKDEEIHQLYTRVMGLLNEDGATYKLHLANRLYAHESNLSELRGEFTGLLKKHYGSELQSVNFGQSEQARGIINQWVSEETNQKIKDLIPSGVLSSLTRLVLVNAIYFKGDWKTKFNAEATRPRSFYAGHNKEVQVQMMAMHGKKFFYDEQEQFQILGMPYQGDELFMFIVLPREQDGLAKVEKSLGGRKLLESVLRANRERKIEHVVIPKFKLEETVDLVKILKHLGATDMFDDKSDFSNINGRRDLYISDVIHKAFIEVNEEGTEAAAATAAVANLRCAMPMNPSFVADHPFLFTIVDIRSNSILFLGRYAQPK